MILIHYTYLKVGIFFIFIDEDARIASRLLNLKLTPLNISVVKCGFPIASLDKFSDQLNNFGYVLKIIDHTSNISYTLNDYKINSSINNLLTDINNLDINSLSIREAFCFLEKIQENSKHILSNNTNITPNKKL